MQQQENFASDCSVSDTPEPFKKLFSSPINLTLSPPPSPEQAQKSVNCHNLESSNPNNNNEKRAIFQKICSLPPIPKRKRSNEQQVSNSAKKKQRLLKLQKTSILLQLPNEIFIQIFSFLEFFELFSSINRICSLFNTCVVEFTHLIIMNHRSITLSKPPDIASPTTSQSQFPKPNFLPSQISSLPPLPPLLPPLLPLLVTPSSSSSSSSSLSSLKSSRFLARGENSTSSKRFELMKIKRNLQKEYQKNLDILKYKKAMKEKDIELVSINLKFQQQYMIKTWESAFTSEYRNSSTVNASQQIGNIDTFERRAIVLNLSHCKYLTTQSLIKILQILCQYRPSIDINKLAIHDNMSFKPSESTEDCLEKQQFESLISNNNLKNLNIGPLLSWFFNLTDILNGLHKIKIFDGVSLHAMMTILPNCCNLYALDISGRKYFTNEIISVLPSSLRELNITNVYSHIISDGVCDLSAHCPNLERLLIAEGIVFPSTITKSKPFLKGLRKLKFLDMHNAGMFDSDDELVRYLGRSLGDKNHKLEAIDIRNSCPNIGAGNIERLLDYLKSNLDCLVCDMGTFHCVERDGYHVLYESTANPKIMFNIKVYPSPSKKQRRKRVTLHNSPTLLQEQETIYVSSEEEI